MASNTAGTLASATEPWLNLRGREFRSRLLLGIEQYTEPCLVRDVLTAGCCDVFITTFDLEQTKPSLLMSDLDEEIGLDLRGQRFDLFYRADVVGAGSVSVRDGHMDVTTWRAGGEERVIRKH